VGGSEGTRVYFVAGNVTALHIEFPDTSKGFDRRPLKQPDTFNETEKPGFNRTGTPHLPLLLNRSTF